MTTIIGRVTTKPVTSNDGSIVIKSHTYDVIDIIPNWGGRPAYVTTQIVTDYVGDVGVPLIVAEIFALSYEPLEEQNER